MNKLKKWVINNHIFFLITTILYGPWAYMILQSIKSTFLINTFLGIAVLVSGYIAIIIETIVFRK